MSWFKLKEPMGTNYRVDPGDIMNTKLALYQLGYYQPPKDQGIQPWTDDAMFQGIRRLQQDNNLQVDGYMRPGGPTEKVVNKTIRAQAMAAEGGGDGGDGGDGGGWAYACPSWPSTCNAPPNCGQNPGPGDGPKPSGLLMSATGMNAYRRPHRASRAGRKD